MKNKEKTIKKYQNKEEAENYITSRYKNSFFEVEDETQKIIINKKIKNNFIEIAPGTGRISSQLPKSIKKGVLIDSSSRMEAILKKHQRFKVIRADFFKIKLKNKFNFAFAFRFLRHLNKEERILALKKINSLLKKDSLFIFEALNNKYYLINSVFKRKSVYDEYFSPAQIKEELKSTGFSLQEMHPVYKLYPLQRILYVLTRIFGQKTAVNAVRNIDNKLNLKSSALEWIIIAKKTK